MPEKNQQTRIVHPFNTKKFPYKIFNASSQFEGKPPEKFYAEKPNFDGIFQHYKKKIKNEKDLQKFSSLQHWQEQVLNLKNHSILKNYSGQQFEFDWLTSHDIVAERLGILKKDVIFPLAAIGVAKTKDNHIVLGVRSVMNPLRDIPEVKTLGQGLIGFPPGGSVTYQTTYEVDPITDTIIDETKTELGDFAITSYRLLGIFYAEKPGPIGYKFVSLIELDATLAEVIAVNAKANLLYKNLLQKENTIKEAKALLKKENYPIDAWEHNPLFGMYNDKEILQNLLTFKHLFSGIGYGTLMTYLHWLENN